ncbi:MAG: DNA starvation/stationary phase protection protein [Pseudomonadota bacterium]
MSTTAQSLGQNARADIAEALNQSLAELQVTTSMAQTFHWNVKGMAFGPLHALFQEIYEDHFAGQDDLAERVRAIGAHAGGKLADAVARASVSDHDGNGPAEDLVRALAEAEEIMAQVLATTADVADQHGDLITQDLCIARGSLHEKFAWMLKAHLG